MDIEALAIPVSCNTIITSHNNFKCVKQTKIGSPYVIEEFKNLANIYQKVAGFEANGGFLLGTNITIRGKKLSALPTRDAVLPFLMLLSAAKEKNISQLVKDLPQRITFSDRIQNFSTEKSKSIIKNAQDNPMLLLRSLDFKDVRVSDLNTVDGLRITLSNGHIIHLRPSGNAPELRCYAEADDIETARSLVEQTLGRIKNFPNTLI